MCPLTYPHSTDHSVVVVRRKKFVIRHCCWPLLSCLNLEILVACRNHLCLFDFEVSSKVSKLLLHRYQSSKWSIVCFVKYCHTSASSAERILFSTVLSLPWSCLFQWDHVPRPLLKRLSMMDCMHLCPMWISNFPGAIRVRDARSVHFLLKKPRIIQSHPMRVCDCTAAQIDTWSSWGY